MSAPLPPPGARLMMILPPSATARTKEIVACLEKGDVAAVIWRGGSPPLPEEVEAVEQQGAAALMEGASRLTAPLGLDGAHVTGLADLKAALSALKPDGIVGVGGLSNRHDAMTAGESGADYVLFGSLDGRGHDFPRTLDLLSWWVDLFEVPCVGVATSLSEAQALAQAGADFVALAEPLVLGPDGPAHVAQAQALIEAARAAQDRS